MTTPRHRAREVALQILYRYDAAAHSAQPEGAALPQAEALVEDLRKHFDHFQVPENLRGFASELVSGTLLKMTELDQVLEAKTPNWKISRMSSIDRSLLRMALYELMSFPDIPASVTIDEAVELSKQFGSAESSSFVNGVLDAIRQDHSETA
jgi:N utilization substance protein B